MNVKYYFLVVLLLPLLSSCVKKTVQPASTIITPKYDVYISGYVDTVSNTQTLPAYWKNSALSVVGAGYYDASVNDITVGTLGTVYMAGSKLVAIGSKPPYRLVNVATYWINGKPVRLVSDTTHDSSASKIAVYSNNIYVIGSTHNDSIPQPVLWKNGLAEPLTFSSPAVGGQATAIALSGNDIYIAGNAYTKDYYGMAVYWKNGQQVALSEPNSTTTVNAIAVNGSDVYVAGQISNYVTAIATYWKNGVAHSLSTDTIDSRISSLIINNNDVYIAGKAALVKNQQTNNLTYGFIYWKNGVIGNADWTKNTTTYNSVTVSNIGIGYPDVYAAGTFNNRAVYWLNGKMAPLYNSISGASGIFIQPH
ncbi:MAG TPA: hypothetical protein VHB54_20965 [Mucilaginibacter sp.]|nr:hypothetical protein [Mucilaginibacter sp.]